MTLTELRYIVALAQEQHFGRAAERCHVSQPTLSIAVKKLEEELGVLFERGKQKVLPTPLGESPSGVGRTFCLPRSNSTPNSSSSFLTAMLSVGWLTWQRSAARPKCCSCARATM